MSNNRKSIGQGPQILKPPPKGSASKQASAGHHAHNEPQGGSFVGTVSEQLAMAELDYYAATTLSLMAPIVVVFGIAIWVIRDALSPAQLGVWACTCAAFIIFRTCSLRRYRELPPEKKAGRLGRLRFELAAASLVNGLIWGLLCLLSIPKLTSQNQMLITWIAVVASSVASVSLPLGPVVLRSYFVATLGPCATAWLIVGGRQGLIMALSMLLAFWVYSEVGKRHRASVLSRLHQASDLFSANQLLQKLSSSKTRLLVEASHDLRQPVHTLGMMLERINLQAPKHELDQKLQEIRNCVATVSDMLTDLLDLSKLESGDISVELQAVSIGAMLREMEETFAPMAERKGLHWVVASSSEWGLTDRGMFKRVLYNLVSNAIKYTRTGSVTVRCKADGDLLYLQVRDTGSGIPADKLNVIFSEYVRLDDAEQEPGYGIGLAVVRRIIELLGHKITVSSREGRGTIFTVTLARAAGQAELATQPAAKPADTTTFAGRTVVFVENDELLRKSTAEVLRSVGIQVADAASEDQIRMELRKLSRRPDLVISDMHLGGPATGLDVIERLRHAMVLPDLPAILLTGDLTRDVHARARALRVRVAYKPVKPTRLKELVSMALRGVDFTESLPHE